MLARICGEEVAVENDWVEDCDVVEGEGVDVLGEVRGADGLFVVDASLV